MAEMTRWRLTIEYVGTDYCGWQRQEPGTPSVQAAIEDAIKKFCQQDITIHAAGRTDTGVHAKGQVAHFDLDYGTRKLSGHDLAKALNAHLRPQPVAIVKAEPVADDFHARFSAKNKLYQYRILNRPALPVFDQARVWYFKRPLNVEAMVEGAVYLTGHHDFTSFRASECQAKSPERTLERLDITTRAYDEFGGCEILIEAEARSFLHHMVRNIVGTLSLVGEGKWKPFDIKTALEASDRTKSGPTAPPDGLTLMRVDY
jgi:tRNA pseudouridine38-40 synthase